MTHSICCNLHNQGSERSRLQCFSSAISLCFPTKSGSSEYKTHTHAQITTKKGKAYVAQHYILQRKLFYTAKKKKKNAIASKKTTYAETNDSANQTTMSNPHIRATSHSQLKQHNEKPKHTKKKSKQSRKWYTFLIVFYMHG